MSTPASDRFLGFVNALQLFVGRELTSAETLILASIFPSLATRGSTGADAVSLAAQAMNNRQKQAGKSSPGEGVLADILDQVASLEQLRTGIEGQGTSLPMAQLAERLITLIKAEVENCFGERFEPLNKQMAEAVQQLHALLQQQAAAAKTTSDSGGENPPKHDNSSKEAEKSDKNSDKKSDEDQKKPIADNTGNVTEKAMITATTKDQTPPPFTKSSPPPRALLH